MLQYKIYVFIFSKYSLIACILEKSHFCFTLGRSSEKKTKAEKWNIFIEFFFFCNKHTDIRRNGFISNNNNKSFSKVNVTAQVMSELHSIALLNIKTLKSQFEKLYGGMLSCHLLLTKMSRLNGQQLFLENEHFRYFYEEIEQLIIKELLILICKLGVECVRNKVQCFILRKKRARNIWHCVIN